MNRTWSMCLILGAISIAAGCMPKQTSAVKTDGVYAAPKILLSLKNDPAATLYGRMYVPPRTVSGKQVKTLAGTLTCIEEVLQGSPNYYTCDMGDRMRAAGSLAPKMYAALRVDERETEGKSVKVAEGELTCTAAGGKYACDFAQQALAAPTPKNIKCFVKTTGVGDRTDLRGKLTEDAIVKAEVAESTEYDGPLPARHYDRLEAVDLAEVTSDNTAKIVRGSDGSARPKISSLSCYDISQKKPTHFCVTSAALSKVGEADAWLLLRSGKTADGRPVVAYFQGSCRLD